MSRRRNVAEDDQKSEPVVSVATELFDYITWSLSVRDVSHIPEFVWSTNKFGRFCAWGLEVFTLNDTRMKLRTRLCSQMC